MWLQWQGNPWVLSLVPAVLSLIFISTFYFSSLSLSVCESVPISSNCVYMYANLSAAPKPVAPPSSGTSSLIPVSLYRSLFFLLLQLWAFKWIGVLLTQCRPMIPLEWRSRRQELLVRPPSLVLPRYSQEILLVLTDRMMVLHNKCVITLNGQQHP